MSDLLQPKGDPAVLRRAAASWRAMSAEILETQMATDASVRQLASPWAGDAARAFTESTDRLLADVLAAASTCVAQATDLDEAADQIANANESLQELATTIAFIVAAGVVVGASGVGAPVASVATGGAVGLQVTRAQRIVSALAVILRGKEVAATSFSAAFRGYASSFMWVNLGSIAPSFANRMLSGTNPFDLSTWRIDDISGTLVLNAAIAATFRVFPVRLQKAPSLGRAALSGVARTIAIMPVMVPVMRFGIYDAPMTPREWGAAGIYLGATVVGTAMTYAIVARYGGIRPPYPARSTVLQRRVKPSFQTNAVSLAGIPLAGTTAVNALTLAIDAQVIPSDPPFVMPSPSFDVALLPAPPLKPTELNILRPDERLAAPPDDPTFGVVGSGGTLWDMAERAYGPGKGHLWPRIAAANAHLLRDPDLIHESQAFYVPA